MTRNQWLFVTAFGVTVGMNLLAVFLVAAATMELLTQVLLAVVALALFYLGLSTHIDSLSRSVRDVRGYVQRHLEAPVYEADPRLVAIRLRETARAADRFIHAVGGRARDDEYLRAIEERIKEGKDHIRILSGDHILHPLHEHLERLLKTYAPEDPESGFGLGWYPDERFGHFTVSDGEVLLSAATPVRGSPEQSILRIADPGLARDYQQYVERLYSHSLRVDRGSQLLKNLCRDCSPIRDEIDLLKDRIAKLLQGLSDS